MSDNILRDSTTGACWMNSLGYLIKERPFVETLLPSQLLIDADYNSTTTVNNYITEFLDRNGTSNKLIQSNASYQFYKYSDGALTTNLQYGLTYYTSSGFTIPATGAIFCVINTIQPANTNDYFQLLTGIGTDSYGCDIVQAATTIGTDGIITLTNKYVDGVPYTNATITRGWHIISCNYSCVSVSSVLGRPTQGGLNKKVKGIAIYNNVQSIQTHIYNYNALKLRYAL